MTENRAFHLLTRDELSHLVFELGQSDAQIAQTYGVSTNTVNQRRRLMNLMNGQITAGQLADTVRLAEKIKQLPMEAIDQIRDIVHQYERPPLS